MYRFTVIFLFLSLKLTANQALVDNDLLAQCSGALLKCSQYNWTSYNASNPDDFCVTTYNNCVIAAEAYTRIPESCYDAASAKNNLYIALAIMGSVLSWIIISTSVG